MTDGITCRFHLCVWHFSPYLSPPLGCKLAKGGHSACFQHRTPRRHSMNTHGISRRSKILQMEGKDQVLSQPQIARCSVREGSSSPGDLGSSPVPDTWMLVFPHLRTGFLQTQRQLAQHALGTNSKTDQGEACYHWSETQRDFSKRCSLRLGKQLGWKNGRGRKRA